MARQTPAARQSEQEARERLVEAARIAFGSNGFHGTTTRHIAAEAGMSPAAVYVHHPSKEALLFAISREGHLASLDAVSEAAASAGAPGERVRAIVRAFVLRQAEHHDTARIVNYELGALSPEHRSEIDVLRRKIQQTLVDAIVEGVDAGAFPAVDPSLTATAIMGMSIDVGRWYRDEGAWTPPQVADHLAEMAVRMVRG